MSDVVWTTDINLKITFISPSIEFLMGESRQSHLKRTLDEKFPPDSIKKIRDLFTEEMEKEKDPYCNKDRTRDIELEHYRADGTIIWLAMNLPYYCPRPQLMKHMPFLPDQGCFDIVNVWTCRRQGMAGFEDGRK